MEKTLRISALSVHGWQEQHLPNHTVSKHFFMVTCESEIMMEPTTVLHGLETIAGLKYRLNDSLSFFF